MMAHHQRLIYEHHRQQQGRLSVAAAAVGSQGSPVQRAGVQGSGLLSEGGSDGSISSSPTSTSGKDL